MAEGRALYPAFLRLDDLPVVVVGAGPIGAAKLEGLLVAGARITVVAPQVCAPVRERATALPDRVTVIEREFRASDLDGARWVVAAAPAAVNREVAKAAGERGLFVNAVDDPASASAYLGGVVRRGEVELAISTGGIAPALAGLLREALDALLPDDLERWIETATAVRKDWKRDRVPIAERRPLLLQALNQLYADKPAAEDPEPEAKPATGFVSIVGAGPGSPDLLTLRALERLREADLILYDALVEEQLLELAPQAKRFYVGKRAGRHSIEQEGIHRLLIRAAQRGQRVVRLKCGDPFVLGRGAEEALALEAAGVAYEMVPGVSSATAAPALAGIPVTHRGMASGFAVLSGHAATAYGPVVDSVAPHSLTLVVLMGIRTRGEIAQRLIDHGWSPETPAAIVLGASQQGEARWIGTLGTIGAAPIETELPGVIVVGEVVTLTKTIAQSVIAKTAVTS